MKQWPILPVSICIPRTMDTKLVVYDYIVRDRQRERERGRQGGGILLSPHISKIPRLLTHKITHNAYLCTHVHTHIFCIQYPTSNN